MTRLVSRAESFETIEQALNQINFSSFDFYTIKNSLIDYVKLQFPENFNDFIESSEFIAILEIFAYVIELYNYRLDINASENFLSTAERKQSVLKIAKFLSYNASRNIPGRGLVKLQSIKSTENIFDIDGINLNNKTIIWNDPNNIKWKDQFILVMNRILKQEFGSVFPDERIQVNDVLFELYDLENIPLNDGVFPFNTTVSGEQMPMELVSSELNEFGPLERRPEANAAFSILYGSDGLGDSSDTTGFFAFTKQGEIQRQRHIFDGVTPNQTLIIDTINVNDSDIWINNVNPVSGEILNDNSLSKGKSGEWHEVDISHAQNIIFNTNPNRNKFEIETLEDDKIKIIFGDGEFADIPSGSFDIWFRSSIDKNITIPRSSITSNNASLNYIGRDGNTETFTFTYSLINSIQNNSASEDIEHIRKTAPAVYYTQDRMVNGKDYNTFMLQDTSILKLRSLNRTFIGDSKYITWHEPKESYESVKLFGDDLGIYYKNGTSKNDVLNEESASAVFYNQVEPLLASNDFFTLLTSKGITPDNIRTNFTQAEADSIIDAMEQAALSPPQTMQLFYLMDPTNSGLDEWVHLIDESSQTTFDNVFTADLPFSDIAYDPNQVLFNVISPWDGVSLEAVGLIRIVVNGFDWEITHATQRIICQSPETRFWNINDANRVLSFDTLLSNQDEIIILDANKNANRNDLLEKNHHYNVIGQELVEPNIPATGLIDVHQLSILPIDENGDAVPDNMDLPNIINVSITVLQNTVYEFPFPTLIEDITTTGNFTYKVNGVFIASPLSTDIITAVTETNIADAIINIEEYVYFQREEIDLDTGEFTWIPKKPTTQVIGAYIADLPLAQHQWKRENGRFPMNFLWMHRTPRFNLIDPSATNIIDTYIISRSYYTSILEWLTDKTTIIPDEPTSLQLRTDYNELIESKMISDTIILHSGKIKILFGDKSIEQLQAKFKVIRKDTSRLTNNQIKTKVIGIIKEFFDINLWEFGETFYMTELASKIHINMVEDIKSVVLVPLHNNNLFGDLFIVPAREDEIFQPHIGINNIEIVSNYTSENIKQEPR